MNTTIDHQGVDDGVPSEMQTMIADSVERLFAKQVTRELLERFDAGHRADALWQMVVDNGLPGALVPEGAGGSGANWLDASPVLRAIGYWQAPLPLAETMLAAALLAHAGMEVPEGPITLIQAGRLGDLQLDKEGARLDGQVVNVPWARTCRWAVVADGQHLALVDLRQATITLAAGSNFADEERDALVFANASTQATGQLQLAGLHEPVWHLGALVRACMLVGTLEAVVDKAVMYANERVQFGKPIGKQQVLQQYLAQMAGATGTARMAVQVALRSASDLFLKTAGSSNTLAFDIAVAKVCAGEAATLAASVAHQVHGAIGFTHEHTLHFATRRLWSWRDEFGSDAHWAKVLGQAAIAAGSEGFWAGLTDRSL
ncbi:MULTISPECIES: acyl-CoA dehydrogenase family protein [Pseudomonas]|uniref:acyl-CoA dehydrogenase family protein n=1 Tax=Pseudomonas TaxID=286 RepID=UPI00048A4D08|nr:MULTISPECIES: acyl-CoA dehydrogenase family protein [Pseudomonas]MDD1977564.1 acyl-CoA dehydrogenase family protein [Pseudomonas putida]